MAFDITQIFPLLNHQLLSLILNKAGFDPKIFFFLSNYLIGRKTHYLWNNFVSSFFNVDQDSALSPILSALYILLIFYIFEKISKNIKIPVSFFSLLTIDFYFNSQEKSFEKSNTFLFCSHTIILFLINQFGLVIEYRKSKVFHLSSLSPLNLSPLRGPTLHLKDNWKYLDSIFDKKLLFQQHVHA